MSPQPVYCGIDVSKLTLDAFCLDHYCHHPNDPKGWRDMIAWLERISPSATVVAEATGGYEQAPLAAFRQAGHPTSVVQPLRVRQFASSMGRLAKTDRIDAKVIADFAQVAHPKSDNQKSKLQERLASFVSFRDQIKLKIVALRNQMELCGDPLIAASAERLLKAHGCELVAIAKAIDALMVKSDELVKKLLKLTAFEGVGNTTALSLLAYLPELGCVSKREIAALVGVAPFNHDSGRAMGKRSIHGGRACVRTALYMAALTAARCNPVLSKFYKLKRSQGKLPKVALVAVMRKLLIALNSALKNPHFSLVS
jgi:transposase